MTKKDLPTLLKLRAEHNLDQEWLIDRIEEYIAQAKQSVAEEILGEIEKEVAKQDIYYDEGAESELHGVIADIKDILEKVKRKYLVTEGKYK